MAEFVTNCKMCGKVYTAQRSTSKYCSSKCRQRFNRAHTELTNVDYEAVNMRDSIARLLSLSDAALVEEFWKLEPMFNDLRKLRHRAGVGMHLGFSIESEDD